VTAPLHADERAALVRLLAEHDPADGAERRHVRHVQDFCERHANPFDRRLAHGHLTGSAFVLDPAGRLLLTHHRRLGIWVQLGGHSDGERRAEEVALREAREESGLDDLRFFPALRLDDGGPRLLDVDVHAIPAREAEPAHEHLDLRFLLVTAEPGRIVVDPGEARALEWVELEEAARRGDAGLRRAVGKVRMLRSALT
jgi:8-oxo-dGTP pyrophosphatase MutT (NUDIX family)